MFFFPIVRGQTFSEVGERQDQFYPWAASERIAGDGRVLHYDQADSFYPWQVFTSRALRRGEFPLWNPSSFGGSPFLANGQSGVLYPPRLALVYTVSPPRVHDLLLASHLFLAGVAMFLLLGFVGLSFPSALVGALAWMLNSFGLAWQALENYTAIGVWLPIGVLLTHAVVRRRSWLAAMGLALALGLLFVGGNVLFVELVVATVLAYGLFLAVVDGIRSKATIAGNVARLGTAAVLFLGLTAVSSVPTIELSAESVRAPLSYHAIGAFALSWRTLSNILQPPDFLSGDPYHQNLFAGTAAAVLAVIGVTYRAALARFAVVLAAVVLLFMLHTPVTWIVDVLLPGMNNLKPLARAAFLFNFALAVLAGFGLERVLPAFGRPSVRRLLTSPLLVGAAVGAVFGAIVMRLGRARIGGSTILILLVVLAVLFAIAVEDRRVRSFGSGLRSTRFVRAVFPNRTSALRRLIVAAAAASIVGQALLEARQVMPHQPSKPAALYPPTPLIRYLERYRQARFLPTVHTFGGSTAMIFGLRSVGGYESLLPGRIEDFWRSVGEGLAPQELASNRLIYAYQPEFDLAKLRPGLLARAGVAYVVASPRAATQSAVPRGLALRYAGPDGRVFEVSGATPNAYLAEACDVAATRLEALGRFIASSSAETVTLEGESLRRAGQPCSAEQPRSAGDATVVQRSINTLAVRVRARHAAWLVVTDNWDKGWKATVDGHRTAVLPADSVFRAVRVPTGNHLVRFDYEPGSFRTGAVISAVSLALVLGGLVIGTVGGVRKRGRR
jgi:hypothetical protein